MTDPWGIGCLIMAALFGIASYLLMRNLGVTTIVGVGVSLNVGMTNLAFDGVNHGYHSGASTLTRSPAAGGTTAPPMFDNTLNVDRDDSPPPSDLPECVAGPRVPLSRHGRAPRRASASTSRLDA